MAQNLSSNGPAEGRRRGRPPKNGGNPYGDALAEQIHTETNMSNRGEIIRGVYRGLANLEAERKRIGREISELKQKRVKGDLGMQIVDFNIGYRLYQLEHEDRDECLDTIRECFNALGVGEQVNWVSAMETRRTESQATDDPGA
jgi:hypothetical protein